MIDISVIIVTYNSDQYISNALYSIFNFEKDEEIRYEIIIVDNSDDFNHEILKTILKNEFSNRKIKLIKNPINGGYGQGNNLGIKEAKGRLIAIMNPDIIHTETLFKNVLTTFQKIDNLGMLGFKQIGGNNFSFYFRPEFEKPIVTNLLNRIFNKINFFDPAQMFLSGAYFFIPKKVIDHIGAFDENMFLYGEESDITKRLLINNYKIKYTSQYSYIHDIDGRTVFSNFNLKCLLDSVKYYCEKYSFKFEDYQNFFLIELKIKKIIFQCFRRSIKEINNQIHFVSKYK